MAFQFSVWVEKTLSGKGLRVRQPQPAPAEEADLYFRRALLAASEERYDDARVFCQKALLTSSDHLGARFLYAWLQETALGDIDGALNGYRKVIALAGYETANTYCAAAREALSRLMSRITEAAGMRG